jgi:hypothetical protein
MQRLRRYVMEYSFAILGARRMLQNSPNAREVRVRHQAELDGFGLILPDSFE